ncbi:MAG: gliding motility protein GldN [Sphingobacteriaceae bacterium]
MKKKIFVIGLCFLSIAAYAQKKTVVAPKPRVQQSALIDTLKTPVIDTANRNFDRPTDGYYKKMSILSARVTPYANMRESDVWFSKRVWREIDVREKMNQYLASPKARLIDILMNAISAGELAAYDVVPTKDDPNGDEFSTLLKPGQVMAKLADSVLVDQFNNEGEKVGSRMMPGEFNPDSVIRFRIKEDWVFDKQRSVFEPRIIGLAPLIRPKAGGIDLDFQPAFWVYFPDARAVLAVKEAVNRRNDATGLSFDDVFMKRLFSSFIVKESNDKDERIKDYTQGLDRLYESEKVKKTLMDFESNLWQY